MENYKCFQSGKFLYVRLGCAHSILKHARAMNTSVFLLETFQSCAGGEYTSFSRLESVSCMRCGEMLLVGRHSTK